MSLCSTKSTQWKLKKDTCKVPYNGVSACFAVCRHVEFPLSSHPISRRALSALNHEDFVLLKPCCQWSLLKLTRCWIHSQTSTRSPTSASSWYPMNSVLSCCQDCATKHFKDFAKKIERLLPVIFHMHYYYRRFHTKTFINSSTMKNNWITQTKLPVFSLRNVYPNWSFFIQSRQAFLIFYLVETRAPKILFFIDETLKHSFSFQHYFVHVISGQENGGLLWRHFKTQSILGSNYRVEQQNLIVGSAFSFSFLQRFGPKPDES